MADQEQPLSNFMVQFDKTLVTDEAPIIDSEINENEEPIVFLEWSTSLICGLCREGDISTLRGLIAYSLQNLACGEHARDMTDRLDVDTGLSPLHYAARYHHLSICLLLLSNIEFKLGVNIKDEHGRTPIHSMFRSSSNFNKHSFKTSTTFNMYRDFGDKIQDAETWKKEYINIILSNDHPLIYLFAKANGDLNARDKYLLTPLHYAVTHNNLNGVKELIKCGADVKVYDRQDVSPLHLACKEGYLSIAEYLIEQGSIIDATDADKWTPLHYACSRGHTEIIKLIKFKYETKFKELIQMKTERGVSCLHLAIQHGNFESVEYILKQLPNDHLQILINEPVHPLGTPLHIAAKYCDVSMIDLLYRHGSDPSILNSRQQSALHIACHWNQLSIVKELHSLTQRSLLEIKDNQGRTPLSVTTNIDIINELISMNADIFSLDKNSMNVLMVAISKCLISIVEHLLLIIDNRFHEIFDQVTKDEKRSIFLLAIETGSIDMCSLLLKHPGVHWDTVDKRRMNGFHIAAYHNHYQLIEHICEYIRKINRSKLSRMQSYALTPTTATNFDLINIPQRIPVLCSYLDAQNDDGKTPLYLAAERGHTFSVQTLLKYGANALLTNYFGQLPLHAAVQNGYTDCVALLLKVSLRNITDFQSILSLRQSPLIIACQNGFVDIFHLLLLLGKIGIEYGHSTSDQYNPLEMAIKYRRKEMIYLLLRHPYFEYWLVSRRKNVHVYYTPLRDMIRHMPECAQQTFDKFVSKTYETDSNGNECEITTYNYKYIDDYFITKDKPYSQSSHELYRNHPFTIALDSEHYALLEHPLAQQLIARKWKLYRALFYFARILTFTLLFLLTFHVLIKFAPDKKSLKNDDVLFFPGLIILLQWAIFIFALINLCKPILEAILYRGLRVPFAQIFSILSYLTAAIAFMPYTESHEIIHFKWQLTAFSVLLQWFNAAFTLRSVPFIGNFIVMFQSILINFFSIIFVIFPLLIAFSISIRMTFYNHLTFSYYILSISKLTAMITGEVDYETLFYPQPVFSMAAVLIFIPFFIIMTILSMNILLAVTIGDLQSCLDDARAKANAYRIRELLYIESTLPSWKWLKSNVIEYESIDSSSKDSISKTNYAEEDSIYRKSFPNVRNLNQLGKLLDILNLLCKQAKYVLKKQTDLESLLKRLINIRKAYNTNRSVRDTR